MCLFRDNVGSPSAHSDFEPFVASNIPQLGGGGSSQDLASTPMKLTSSSQLHGSTNHVESPAVMNTGIYSNVHLLIYYSTIMQIVYRTINLFR